MEQHETKGMPEMRWKRLYATLADTPLQNWTLRKHRRSSWFYALMGLSTGIAVGTLEAMLLPKFWYVFTALQFSLLTYGLLFVRQNWREMERDHKETEDELRAFMAMLEREGYPIPPKEQEKTRNTGLRVIK